MFLPINLMNVQAATGFDYPPGRYLFQVKDVELKTNTDGVGQRLVVNNIIIMGPGLSQAYAGRPLGNSYQMTEKGAPFFKRFCLAIGITDENINANGGQIDDTWLKDRQYVAAVIKNGNYCNISNERPLSEWNNGVDPAAKQATAPTSAPPPAHLAPVAQQPMHMAPPPMAPVLPAPQIGIPAGIPAPVPPPGRVA